VCDISGAGNGDEAGALSYDSSDPPLFCSASDCYASDDGATGSIPCGSAGGVAGGRTGACTCSCNAGYEGTDCTTAIICDADQYVSDNACAPCAAGATNAAGDDASGADTACEVAVTTTATPSLIPQTTTPPPSQTDNIEGSYSIAGISQTFFNDNTQAVTAALRSTLATTAGVALDAVTMIEVKYVSEAARRLLADGDGTVTADYAITFSSADEADAAVSNIMDTAAGTAATDFVNAFVQTFNNDAVANVGDPLNATELSVAAVEAEVAVTTQSNDGSDGSSDGTDTTPIIVAIILAVLCVIVAVIICVIVSRKTSNEEDHSGHVKMPPPIGDDNSEDTLMPTGHTSAPHAL